MNMNILLSCDDKYIKYAYVLLESLFSNHSDPMHIYMVYNNAESELYRDLKNFAEGRGDNVMEICDVSHIDIGSLRNSSRFPLECYYTLFPQLYLPESVERILYLDIDTIVDRNLTRFYNSDFEENYLIACGQSQGFKKTDDMPPPKVFGYFNSGVILYNIKKMRQEVSIDKYEYVFSHSDDFFFDQGMLNHLFYKDTKYEETLLYNFRSNIAFGRYFDQAVEMVENREVYIYHYTCKGIPYKPWDLVIEDESFFDDRAAVPISSDYFHLSKEVNNSLKIWWEYASKTPEYDKLYRDMKTKREYVLSFKIPDRINNLSQKYEGAVKKQRLLIKKYGALSNRTEEIRKLQTERNTEYLEAVKGYYGFPVPDQKSPLCDISDVSEYFEQFKKQDNNMMIISCKDTCEKYFDTFAKAAGIALKKPKFRESYIAIIFPDGELMEKISSDEIVYRYDYKKNKGVVTSRGYDKQTSYSEIVFDSIDYSMNLIGLNIAVIDTSAGEVIDSFNINTHRDEEITIRRLI